MLEAIHSPLAHGNLRGAGFCHDLRRHLPERDRYAVDGVVRRHHRMRHGTVCQPAQAATLTATRPAPARSDRQGSARAAPVDRHQVPHDQCWNDHRQRQADKHQASQQERCHVAEPESEQLDQVDIPESFLFHPSNDNPARRAL